MTLRYLSVCSGIEAATVAWHPLGWQAAAFSEIEPFPRAVLARRWPDVPLHGDFTTIGADEYGPIDLLVGGTPCQSFSIAGLRGGLGDERGSLALEFLRLADRKRPRWVVWENVPGVLSLDGGRAFGSILGGLVECGYGFAYRILDAQYFRLAQKRQRVFVVGYLGDWRPAAAVLFEPEGLRRNPPPRRKAGAVVAALTARGVGTCGADDNQAQAGHLIAFDCKSSDPSRGVSGEIAGTLRAMAHAGSHQNGGGNLAICFQERGRTDGRSLEFQEELAYALTAPKGGGRSQERNICADGYVRRLTPRECERLQGFPDDYTLIPWRKALAPDGLRYRALGNSMAVPVMVWIGRRIDAALRGRSA